MCSLSLDIHDVHGIIIIVIMFLFVLVLSSKSLLKQAHIFGLTPSLVVC